MQRKINILRTLPKLTGYAIILLLSQPASALLILESDKDTYGEGLSEELIRNADAAVEIPMYGLKQSLNVSVAYGIVIYHALGIFLR